MKGTVDNKRDDPDAIAALIARNLNRVERRIAAACETAKRDRSEVLLVAVSKGRSAAQIVAACSCGLRQLGENRIEELEAKRPLVEDALAPERPTWHMIGHVQSRKADRVAAAGVLVHSVDTLRLAQRLERYGQAHSETTKVLLQVNVSGEESKYGFDASTDEAESAFVDTCAGLRELAHVHIEGLMTIAPAVQDAEETRPVFRRLRRLRDRLRTECPWSQWNALSMGMSDDFEIAIQEGATMVRIGRALFEPQESE